MLALQIIAAIFMFLSAALFFGPQLVVYGPRAFPALAKQPQARFVGGMLATVLVAVLTGPYWIGAMHEGGRTMTVIALEVAALSFA